VEILELSAIFTLNFNGKIGPWEGGFLIFTMSSFQMLDAL
jgi:hypothetical protein